MKRKNRFILFLLCLSIILHTVPYVHAEGTVKTQQEYHFVVVYDVSGSMDDVDTGNQIRDMIALFIDKIRSDMFPVKFAVLPFGTKCPAVNTMEPPSDASWWTLDSYRSEDISELKKRLSTLGYTSNYTDIGQALHRCNSILSEMREDVDDYTQVVLFITDGFPDLPGETNEDKFQSICASYGMAIQAAESFPVDAYFLGIVPDEESRNGALVYNDDYTQITQYCGYSVPERYGEKMVHVSQCVQEFCGIVRERQGENQTYPAKACEVDWQNSDAVMEVDKIYKIFFEQVFSAHATEKTQQDLTRGISFTVPETVSEINVTIIPEVESLDELGEAVRQGAHQLEITCDNGTCNPFITNSNYAITAKLIDPPAGTYTLQSELLPSATLLFYAYGALQIVSSDSQVQGIVGDSVCFEGELVNGAKQRLSEASHNFITLSVDGLESNYESSYEDGNWSISFMPEEAGEYDITLKIVYNDTDRVEFPGGISNFHADAQFHVIITDPPAPTESPTPTDSPALTEEPDGDDATFLKSFINSILDFLSAVGPYPVLGTFLFVLGVVFVASRLRRHKFTVILENGTTAKISVPKRKNTYVRTKIDGLEIRYNDKDNWEYIYNNRGPYSIINDTIDL